MNEVYAGEAVAPPRGMIPFSDVMVEQLFAEVWTRPGLDVRERRLLVMGVIAAVGDVGTWLIQVRSAVKNGELTAEQVREILVHLAQYVGYPRLAPFVGPTEGALAELATEG